MSPKRTAATAPVLRRITAEAVLQAWLSGDELTAGDLMSATGLSRPTVHSVCDELIGRGWVTETGAAPAPASVGERTAIQVAASTGGRPSRRYALNAGAGLRCRHRLGSHQDFLLPGRSPRDGSWWKPPNRGGTNTSARPSGS